MIGVKALPVEGPAAHKGWYIYRTRFPWCTHKYHQLSQYGSSL